MFYIHIPIMYFFFVEILLKALHFEITNSRYGCSASELKKKKKKKKKNHFGQNSYCVANFSKKKIV